MIVEGFGILMLSLCVVAVGLEVKNTFKFGKK